MLQWERISVQNSAQVILVEGVLDPDVVESAWQAALRELGLGRVHMDESGYSHEIWSGDPPAPLVGCVTSQLPLRDYLQTEVNRPFPEAPAMPYRPFAMQQAERCYLGIVYQQWVADSVSIRLLMREWFLRIFLPNKARRKLVDLPRPTMASQPRMGLAPKRVLGGVRDLWRWARATPGLARFPAGPEDPRITLHPLALASVDVDRLLMLTRAEGFTINDLMIAALAATLHRQLPAASRMAIATTVDLRPYLPGDHDETFGSLLAYAPVICEVPSTNLLNLAQDVGRQTRRIKDPERIAGKLLLQRIAARRCAGKSSKAVLDFCRKRIPLVGAVANVNLNKSWPPMFTPSPLLRYLRLASPSPCVPVTVSISTLNDSLEIVLAAHRGTIADESADQIAEDFAHTLRSLVQSRAKDRPDQATPAANSPKAG